MERANVGEDEDCKFGGESGERDGSCAELKMMREKKEMKSSIG